MLAPITKVAVPVEFVALTADMKVSPRASSGWSQPAAGSSRKDRGCVEGGCPGPKTGLASSDTSLTRKGKGPHVVQSESHGRCAYAVLQQDAVERTETLARLERVQRLTKGAETDAHLDLGYALCRPTRRTPSCAWSA